MLLCFGLGVGTDARHSQPSKERERERERVLNKISPARNLALRDLAVSGAARQKHLPQSWSGMNRDISLQRCPNCSEDLFDLL